jgi:histidinol-phosphate aminotransferase
MKPSFRPDLKNWVPYSSARSLVKNKQNMIFLDANENPYGEWNRYPDPHQTELKKYISKIKKVPLANIMLGNGSDEVLDLCMRLFCVPGKDKVLICPPTYGMYEVLAKLNMLQIIKVPLNPDNFQIDIHEVQKQIRIHAPKMLILCSPNNPTGNLLHGIAELLEKFNGWVVVDEAYIDFCPENSMVSLIRNYPNLVAIQTLSKAWGLASARIGMAFAGSQTISMLSAIKPPYNIGEPSLKVAMKILQNPKKNYFEPLAKLNNEKKRLFNFLKTFPLTSRVFHSDANFILLQSEYAKVWQQYLLKNKIVVRDRSSQIPNAFRVSVGTKKENDRFIKVSLNFCNQIIRNPK